MQFLKSHISLGNSAKIIVKMWLNFKRAWYFRWLWLCIYIPHVSLYSAWRFTILFSLAGGEIGRQLVKALLGAAISP